MGLFSVVTSEQHYLLNYQILRPIAIKISTLSFPVQQVAQK